MLKIFEAFAGYGSQRMAIKRLGVEYESVGISEIEENVINSYAYIHEDLEEKLKTFDKDYPNITKEEMIEYLESINVPLNYKTFKNMARKLPKERLKRMYLANKLSKNYGDISKINPEELPYFDLFTYSFPCFTKDTLVLTDLGNKKISDIKVGDRVLTHKNLYQRVTASGKTGTKKIYKVNYLGDCSFKATANHKFLVKSNPCVELPPEWKELKDLNQTDYLGFPINNKSSIPEWHGLDYDREPDNQHAKNLNQSLMTNEYFWYIVGTFIRYGIIKNKVVEIEIKEEPEVNGLLKALDKCGIYSWVTKKQNSFQVVINLNHVVGFLSDFGVSKHDKHITAEILNLPILFLKYFLKGFFGIELDQLKEDYSFTVESKSLIYEILHCIAKVYKTAYPMEMNTGLINSNKITVTLDIATPSKVMANDKYIWFPVEEVKFVGVQDVYDITVNNNHSFIANGVMAHNCQDISIAGKQQGFEKDSGTRSSLLWECCKIIETVKPKYLLMENVKNLVSRSNIEYFNQFLEYLDSVGYKNYWQILNAKDYGIPQNRERVFCISIRKDIDQEYVFPDKKELTKHLKDVLEKDVEPKFYLSKKNLEGFKIKDAQIAKEAPSLTLEDNNKIIQVGELSLGNNESNNRVYDNEGISPTLNTMTGGHRQPKIISSGVSIAASRGRYIDNSKETEQNLEINNTGVSNTITSVQKDNLVVESYVARKYNEFYEKHGYIPDIFNPYDCCEVKNTSLTVLTTTGNGTSISGMLVSEKHPINGVSEGKYKVVEVDFNGVNIGAIIIKNTLYFIRKLTPKECFRLMGVNDYDFEKIKETSNSALYRQAGNSIVVDVLEEIFRNLIIKENE